MNRKAYFKDKAIIFIVFPIFGTISLFTMDDASTAWRIAAPIFLYGIAVGTALYGFLKYKK